MEVITDLRLVALVGDFPNNIEIAIDKDSLELKIDSKRLFQTLKDRKAIVGFINKKLDSLVEEHLSNMAKKQNQAKEDL